MHQPQEDLKFLVQGNVLLGEVVGVPEVVFSLLELDQSVLEPLGRIGASGVVAVVVLHVLSSEPDLPICHAAQPVVRSTICLTAKKLAEVESPHICFGVLCLQVLDQFFLARVAVAANNALELTFSFGGQQHVLDAKELRDWILDAGGLMLREGVVVVEPLVAVLALLG